MLFLSLFGCKSSFKGEDLLSTVKKDNADFSVKITSYKEKRDFAQVLGGAYYVFEVKTKNEQDWKKIMVVEHDDPIPIDKNSIGFVDEKIGFVFMLKKYAVTTDSGVTWKTGDISQISYVKSDPSCRIQNVKIEENGIGMMNLECNNAKKVLFTKDYGTNWNNESSN